MRIIAPLTVAAGLLMEVWFDDQVTTERLHHLLMVAVLVVHARRLYLASRPD